MRRVPADIVGCTPLSFPTASRLAGGPWQGGGVWYIDSATEEQPHD